MGLYGGGNVLRSVVYYARLPRGVNQGGKHEGKIVRENGGANQASAQVCSDCCRGIAGSLRHNAPYCPLSGSLAGVLRMVKFRGGSARRGY